MTDIIQDSVDVNLQIGTESIVEDGFSSGTSSVGESEFDDDAIFWDCVEVEVEITQVAMPNYVKGKVVPRPEYDEVLTEILNEPLEGVGFAPDQEIEQDIAESSFPNNGISKLVGARFRLEADTDIVAAPSDGGTSTRTISGELASQDVEEDNLLFDGRLANISPVGTDLYEFIAYDPGQQAFNIGEESGSIVNQKLEISADSIGFREPEEAIDNEEEAENTLYKEARTIMVEIVDAAGLENKFSIQDRAFRENNDPNGTPITIGFDKYVVPVKDALDRIREQTNTEWWFDKDGTFYAGDPNLDNFGGGTQVYNLELIKDTSAGITTPPYQSVRVIGSGVATTEGWQGNAKIQDDEQSIIKQANIGLPSAGGEQAALVVELDPENLYPPTFKYINAEIATDEQAQNTAIKIADELIKQQASGTVTVVGFPEVQPFDGIRMPNTEEQRMGGQIYNVYSVKHRLNASDGFITEIEVAGPNRQTFEAAGFVDVGDEGDRNIIPSSTDREVYTPDGKRRAFKSGAGEGGS